MCVCVCEKECVSVCMYVRTYVCVYMFIIKAEGLLAIKRLFTGKYHICTELCRKTTQCLSRARHTARHGYDGGEEFLRRVFVFFLLLPISAIIVFLSLSRLFQVRSKFAYINICIFYILFTPFLNKVMMSEIDEQYEDNAAEHFERSQALAFEAYMAGRALMDGNSCDVEHSRRVLPHTWIAALGEENIDEIHPALDEPYGHSFNIDDHACSKDEVGNAGDGARDETSGKHPCSPVLGVPLSVHNVSFRDGRVFLAHFHNVALSGDDGIIVEQGSGRCSIYIASALNQESLHSNVQMAALWNPGWRGALSFHDSSHGRLPNHGSTTKSVRKITKAVSLIQFAASAYYHFLIEVMGRLIIARDFLRSDPEVHLIIPKDNKRGGGFITRLLELFPDKFDPLRVINYNVHGGPNVRVHIDHLISPAWEPVEALFWDGASSNNSNVPDNITDSVSSSHATFPHQASPSSPYPSASPLQPSSTFSLPSLTPRYVLRAIRSTFSHVPFAPQTTSNFTNYKHNLLIFIIRREKMRGLEDEVRLLEEISAFARTIGLEVFVFDGSSHSTAATIHLFGHARVVVGVHGGALSNTVFSPVGLILIELGFRSRRSWHFSQMAQALDFDYYLVPLVPSERGIAAASVRLGGDGVRRVIDILKARFSCEVEKGMVDTKREDVDGPKRRAEL